MKRFLCFLAMLCAFFSAKATGISTIISNQTPALKIGDQVPDVTVNGVLNSGSNPVHISDFKGKLLILDFWATSCASCIEAMPGLQALQQEFGDKLQILPVSYEKAATVSAFLGRNPVGKALRLPIVTADVQLRALFPHHILSHEAWIGPDGKVLAITGPEYVNTENIRKALSGDEFHLPIKADVMAFDYNKPLLAAPEAPLYYSAVSAYRGGVAPKFGALKDSVHATVRSYVVNFPLLQLYMMATSHLLYFPKTMMDIRVRDSSRVRIPDGVYREEWSQRNNWCYESVLPAGTTGPQRLEAMRQDLNRYFSLNGRMEKRNVRCLSLERLEGTPLPASAGGKPLNTLHSKQEEKVLQNASLSNLIWELNDVPGGLPAKDNTGFKGKVDMHVKYRDIRDLVALNRVLEPYGLTIREQTQELEFFVLTDAGNDHQ